MAEALRRIREGDGIMAQGQDPNGNGPAGFYGYADSDSETLDDDNIDAYLDGLVQRAFQTADINE